MIRWFISIILLFSPVVSFSAPIAIGTYSFPVEGWPSYTGSAQWTWIAQTFGWLVGAQGYLPPLPSNGGLLSTYWDFGVVILEQGRGGINSYKDHVISMGIPYEPAFLHANINYVHPAFPANPTVGTDRFGAWDDYLIHGIYLSDSYTDVSQALYTGGAGNITLNSNLYIGYEEPFDQANFTFSTFASGLSGSWQYWNGSSWTALTVTDGTSGMTTNGQVHFSPPSAWTPVALGGSRNQYWIRFLRSSATVNPVIATLTGFLWSNGGGQNMLGWSPTDSNRINIGTALEYNPSPPSGASAHFPYQARFTSAGWGTNAYLRNPSYLHNGVRVVNSVVRTEYQEHKAINPNVTGIFFDDAIEGPGDYGLPAENTDFGGDDTAWHADVLNKIANFQTLFHALFPNDLVGVNPGSSTAIAEYDISKAAQYNIFEYYQDVVYTVRGTRQWAANGGAHPLLQIGMDDYLTGGDYGLVIHRDRPYDSQGNPGRFDAVDGNIIWDRINRGPILCLATHLIGWNDHTVFSYYTTGNAVYYETDEVHMSDSSTWRQATQGIAPISLSASPHVDHYGTYFPAMSVDFGSPSGGRQVSWRTSVSLGGTDHGDTSGDVHRRDWTNAVVLMRSNGDLTTKSEYDTPGSSISLGGTFYPLLSDGSTSNGITSIQLRCGEAAILMRFPLVLGVDTAPPAITINSPTPNQILPSGTTQTTFSATVTDSTAVSNVRAGSNAPYGSMTNGMTNTSGNTWQITLTGLQDGHSYTECAGAIDSLGNATTSGTCVDFSVASSGGGTPIHILRSGGSWLNIH